MQDASPKNTHTNTNPSSADSRPAHSTLPIRGKPTSKQALSTNLTLHEADTDHGASLRRAETKREKECKLEGWGKETSNPIS